MSDEDKTMEEEVFESGDRTFRIGDYVEVRTRHGTTGNGIVMAFRDNNGDVPDTIALKMDDDTAYADLKRHPSWPHDRDRIPQHGLFGGEIVRIIPKTVH